jgi:hypothetical protein
MKSFYLPIAVGTALLLSGCDTADSNINSSDAEPLLNIYEYREGGTSSLNLNESVKKAISDKCGETTGGLAIYTGFDENSDGQLLEDEYSNSSPRILCNGKESVIETVTRSELDDNVQEKFDEECRFGGVIFRVGIDENGDGDLKDELLENEEAYSHIEWVCKGEDGTDGVDGTVLTKSAETNDANGIPNGYELTFTTDGKEQVFEIRDGVTPVINSEVIAGDQNDEGCFGVGGKRITVVTGDKESSTVICNGANGKDAEDTILNLSLGYDSSTGKVYLKSGDTNITDSAITLATEQSVQLSKVNSGVVCQFGGLTLQNWLDADGDGVVDGNEELGEEHTLCNPSELNATAPVVKEVNITNPANISFSFSEPINPATVHNSTVFLDCNNSNLLSRVNYSYTASAITDFNLITDNNSTPLDYNSSGCKFVITNYIEDINGTRLAETNVTNLQ